MLIVCPNPTIDRYVFVGGVTLGGVLRTRENRAYPGGKPIDTARAMRAHGARADIHVLLPDDGAAWYLGAAAEEDLPVVAHRSTGRVRETIVLAEDSGRVTVINGGGDAVDDGTWAAFVADVTSLIEPGEWVVCGGSFPRGVTDEGVAALVEAVAARGGKLALDTGPAWLRAALAHRPYLITPNLAEAESALSGEAAVESVDAPPRALARAEEAAAGLHAAGVPCVVVTAGEAGLAWCDDSGSGQLHGADVEVVNPIGAGDAFLGGLVASLDKGKPFAEAVRWGMATAASAISQWIPGAADAESTRSYYEELSTTMTKPPKRATLSEIAVDAGVSLTTASRAMRRDPRVAPGTQAKVDQSAHALGFRPNKLARSLKSGTSSAMIALLIPDVADPFFAYVAGGIQDAATERGYVTMLGCHKNVEPEAERIAAQAVGFRPAGIIVTPCRDQVPVSVVNETRYGTPVVLLDRPATNLEADLVATNNEEATTALADGLLGQGIRAFVPVSLDQRMWTQSVRLAALRRRVEAAGGLVSEPVVMDEYGNMDADALLAAISAAPGPLAVVGLSVPPLVRAIEVAKDVDPRPSFACFDTHSLFGLMAVPVWAVRQDARELGRRAVACVLDSLDDTAPRPARTITVPASPPRLYGGIR